MGEIARPHPVPLPQERGNTSGAVLSSHVAGALADPKENAHGGGQIVCRPYQRAVYEDPPSAMNQARCDRGRNSIAPGALHGSILRVLGKKSNMAIAAGLLLAVVLWGASNASTKYVLRTWPPIWTGATRFFCAGALMLALLKWTRWFGTRQPIPRALGRKLWLRGGLSLAVYVLLFNWAMWLTSASHVALYLGMAPVWALVWEERPSRSWRSAQRYGAALLALSGVCVLFWPMKSGNVKLTGEAMGLAASVMWAAYGRQVRALSAKLPGAEISAETMWRAGALLAPFAAVEIWQKGLPWDANVALAQTYCIVGGGVCAYALWNNAFRFWKTSQVFLFNNLIPITTMTWAWICLNEPVTRTYWLAMGLVIAGVVIGQARWEWRRWLPME
jgi:drug/metabolite transporter (DMT)-like permease